jgi:proline iminopeptidase
MHGGLGFDHTCLHPWLDPLGDVLHLVYYDHRGHGRSG